MEALYECLGDIDSDVWQAAVEALKATEGEAAIIKALAHASTNVKIGAIRACRELKPVSRDVQEALVQLLGTDEYEVWQATVELLLEILHVRDFLDILFKHPDPKVRVGVIAIFSWKGIKGDSVIQALIKCLGSVEAVREEAAKTLNSFNKNEAFYKALENPDPSVRAGAAWALGRLHIATLETRKALQKRLGDDEETVRRAAAQALYELEGVNALTEVLLHQSVKIRIGAIQALGWLHINEPFVIEALKERLGDTDDLVRQTSAEVLRDFGHVSAIIDALDHPQHEVRAGAAKALCHLHVVSYPAVEALRKRLSDPHDTVWKAVTETLRRIGRIDIIEEALNDASPSMRGAAARALRYLGIKTPQVLTALKNRLGDDEETVQREAAEALSALGYDKLIIEALSSPEVQVRLGAIRAVEWLNLRNQSAIEVLKERLGDDESSIYESAAEVLIKLRGVGILSNSLSHPNPRVRARAAMLLQKLQITIPEARKALQKCLGDDVEAVRQAAAEALYELWGIEPLVEILKHSQSPKLRSGAAQALQWLRINDRAAIDVLKEALGDSHPQVHGQVTRSLFSLADLEAFIEALGHPASSVRAGAAQALGQLKVTDPAVITALQERLADSSRGVRQAATKALLAIGDLSLIIATLSHPNPSVRIGAAAALKQLKISDATVVTALQQHLSDPVLSVRREVADALFAIGGEAAFIDAFSHPIAEVRLNAILELQRFAMSPVALSELLKRLADEDDKIRHVAAGTLWKSGGIDIFLNALNHFDPRIRVSAIKFIQSLATVTPPVIAVLTECLADGNATVRQEAMEAIQTLGGTDAFIEALQHHKRKIRIAAARALGRLRPADPKVSLALRQSLSMHDLALSLAAAKALLAVSFRRFRLRKPQPHSRHRRVVRGGQQNGTTRRLIAWSALVIGLALLVVLAVRLTRAGNAPLTDSSPEEVVKQLEHPEPSVREKAIRKLQQWKPAQAIPLLQQRLADPVTSVRQAAIQGLFEVGGIDALLGTLSHSSPAIRENAAKSLAGIRHLLPDTSLTRVISSLQYQLADSVTTVRQAAFRTLFEIGGVDALLRAFSHPSTTVRTGAIQALREGRHTVPISSVTAPLQERLADSIVSVRQVALRTLLEIGGIDALFHALSHPSAAVRAQAARALGEIPEDHWQIIPKLQDRLSDPSPAVRQATKEALRKRLQRSHRRM
ncbi:hypothetical protein HRbin21_01562 [bacterium HR21]|nr:hypothetical protein HRbin21_01562 [bacterium HR21]